MENQEIKYYRRISAIVEVRKSQQGEWVETGKDEDTYCMQGDYIIDDADLDYPYICRARIFDQLYEEVDESEIEFEEEEEVEDEEQEEEEEIDEEEPEEEDSETE